MRNVKQQTSVEIVKSLRICHTINSYSTHELPNKPAFEEFPCQRQSHRNFVQVTLYNY